MSTYEVRYWLGDELVGCTKMSAQRGVGASELPLSVSLVCPICGRGYARVEVVGGGYFRHSNASPCADCGSGTLFPKYKADRYIKYAPRSVLDYEFEQIQRVGVEAYNKELTRLWC